jgi:hypothetical protein
VPTSLDIDFKVGHFNVQEFLKIKEIILPAFCSIQRSQAYPFHKQRKECATTKPHY